MTESDQARIAILERRIEQLEALLTKEVARLDKMDKSLDEGFEKYFMQELKNQGETNKFLRETARMARAAFYETHPQALKDLIEAEKITGEWKDGDNDPQP